MTNTLESVRRIARGVRHSNFADPATEKLLSMLITTVQELAVTRDRLDTVERVLEQAKLIDREQLEFADLGADAEVARTTRNEQLLKRVFRPMQQEYEERTGPGFNVEVFA